MRYRPLVLGEVVVLGGRMITSLPVAHTVPAVGYRIDSGRASCVFSGDTGPGPAFWQAVEAIDSRAALIVECAFLDRERALAEVSRHYCPTLLAEALAQLQRPCAIYITHLKPGLADQTMAEIATVLTARQPRRLAKGMAFEFCAGSGMPTLTDLFRRLEHLNKSGAVLSSERDIDVLLEKILLAAKEITCADAGILYRPRADGRSLQFVIVRTDSLGLAFGEPNGAPLASAFSDLPLYLPDGTANHAMVAARSAE